MDSRFWGSFIAGSALTALVAVLIVKAGLKWGTPK
jgi:hypothetical protein